MISVIIPVFNTGYYLHKCLTSLLTNTYSDFELICVDDGSHDDSLQILKEYQSQDSRITVISQENGGVSKARNTGLKAAKGQYICFVDSDDWVHPQYLEALLAGIEKTGADLSIVRYKEIYDYDEEIQNESICISDNITEIGLDNLLNNYKLKSRCWGKLYKKEIAQDLHFAENIRLGEDNLYVFQYLGRLSHSSKVYFADSILYYYYHEREDSAIHTTDYKDTIKTVDHFISEIAVSDRWLKRVYATEGLKKALRIRYMAKIKPAEKEIIKSCNNEIKKIFNAVSVRELSYKDYIIYRVFYLFPWTYRMFMIIKDPTLIQYEKSLKEKNA